MELLSFLPELAVSLVSQVFSIARKSLYTNTAEENKKEEEILKEQILSVLRDNPSYGHRRIAIALGLGKKKIKQYGIKPYKRKARWRKRMDERRDSQPYPNLIKGECPIISGRVLVGDFTHITHLGKVVYIATYMDLYTREIVGWHIYERDCSRSTP